MSARRDERMKKLEKEAERLRAIINGVGQLAASASVRSSGLEKALMSKNILGKEELDALYAKLSALLSGPQEPN